MDLWMAMLRAVGQDFSVRECLTLPPTPVELVLWVVYADLDLIPILIHWSCWRGTFVDAVRAVALPEVFPLRLDAFQVGRFMVKSPLFRSTYAIAKVCLLLLALAYGLTAGSIHWRRGDGNSANFCVVVVYSLPGARIPVLVEARDFKRFLPLKLASFSSDFQFLIPNAILNYA
jgi:hypothetical protein